MNNLGSSFSFASLGAVSLATLVLAATGCGDDSSSTGGSGGGSADAAADSATGGNAGTGGSGGTSGASGSGGTGGTSGSGGTSGASGSGGVSGASGSGGIDAGVDASADASADAAPDSSVDATTDASGDAALDAAPDAPPAKIYKVLHSVGTANGGEITLSTIDTDGNNLTPVAGMAAQLKAIGIIDMFVSGESPARADRPFRETLFGGIVYRLPGGAHLMPYSKPAPSSDSGLALVEGASAVELIAGSLALAGTDMTTSVAPDGTRAIVQMTGTSPQTLLLRTDGQKFSNNQYSAPITATGTVALGANATYAAGRIWFVDISPGGKRFLNYAPLDGSATGTVVTLPDVGAAKQTWAEPAMTTSADGKKLALLAGTSKTNLDLMVVDTTSAAAVNVTKSAGNYDVPAFASEAGFALSPTGLAAAYTRLNATVRELYVIDTTGTGTPIQINTPARMKATLTDFNNLHWMSDTKLLFVAAAGFDGDLYTFDRTTSTLTNLSKTGAETAAPWGPGTKWWRLRWVAQNDGHAFFTRRDNTASSYDLVGINRATSAIVDVASAVQAISDQNLASGANGRVWLSVGDFNPPYEYGLYSFDQNAPAKATLLFSSALQAVRLGPSPDGSMVSLITSSPQGPRLSAVGSTTASLVQLADKLVRPEYTAWTPDSAALVFSRGTNDTVSQPHYQRLIDSQPTAIGTATGYARVFGVQ
ncbi:MAG: hypothetical protein R3B13_33185 [Polyangiaceae bacterium]